MIDPTYTQMVLQLPPDAAVNNPAFVHDYFNTFTTTMFLGCEVGERGRQGGGGNGCTQSRPGGEGCGRAGVHVSQPQCSSFSC